MSTYDGKEFQKDIVYPLVYIKEGNMLQVCHYLMAGQVKSVKPCLKQLQQSIQTIMQPTWPTDESEYLLQGSFSKYELNFYSESGI
jgi:hypothetical protein